MDLRGAINYCNQLVRIACTLITPYLSRQQIRKAKIDSKKSKICEDAKIDIRVCTKMPKKLMQTRRSKVGVEEHLHIFLKIAKIFILWRRFFGMLLGRPLIEADLRGSLPLAKIVGTCNVQSINFALACSMKSIEMSILVQIVIAH